MHRLALAIVPVAALAGSAPFAFAMGSQDAPSARSMTTALNLLEAKGYGDFSNFHASGNHFVAAVTQNGQTFNVTIDPSADQVTRQG